MQVFNKFARFMSLYNVLGLQMYVGKGHDEEKRQQQHSHFSLLFDSSISLPLFLFTTCVLTSSFVLR